MELGTYLVEELKVEPRGDTLGHWLAHHLALLIGEAEREQDKGRQVRAGKDVVEVILKIWDHRSQLPGDVNPLAPYDEILEVLSSMRQNARLWGPHHVGKKHLIRKVHMISSRIVMGMLMLQILPRLEGKKKVRPKVAIKNLSAAEQSILKELDGWMALLDRDSFPVPRIGTKSKRGEDHRGRMVSLVLRWLDDATSTLQEIRTELTGGLSPQL